MRIALVDSTPKNRRSKIYPVSLLKLGRWQQKKGNFCKLFDDALPARKKFDEIWITTCFTFDIRNAKGLIKEAAKRCKKVRVGGIAVSLLPKLFRELDCEIVTGLVKAAEKCSPDYSLLPNPPKYSITHTSRGCLRKCKFCMVRVLEPEFINRPNWVKDLCPTTTKVLFYDNNWLAKSVDDLRADVRELKRLIKAGRIKEIDFNQGMDARLLTTQKADIIKGLPICPIRFAFDNMSEDGHYQKAVRKMVANGYTTFRSYALYNFNDTPESFYYRLRESVLLAMETGAKVESFPMRYHPILEPYIGRDYVGKHWTLQKVIGVGQIVQELSAGHGLVSCKGGKLKPMEEFEFWFGKTAEEFVKLISYPDIKKLTERKTGKLRMVRAGERKRG